MKYYLSIIILFLTQVANCQTTINAMFYNLLNYPTAPPANRNAVLKNILNSYEPDLFFVCELESNSAANSILDFSLNEINKNYNKAQFILNQSDLSPDSSLQQLVFFNSAYFILDNQQTIITNVRDINHYTFIIKTTNYLTNPIYLEVFVTHLKSSQGTNNQQLRLQMVEQFTNELQNLNPNSFVIFAGDFNFYTSSEPGYQKILDTNNAILMKDVLNLNNTLQSWHNNSSWRSLHTQSTRLSTAEFNGFGAGGGLDDRFDFIMLSESILVNSEINFVENSYKNYGNNGNCFNTRIDNTNCIGEFSQELRNNLYNMSDHLPVVLSLETNETLATTSELINENLIKLTKGNLINENLSLAIDNSLQNQYLNIYNYLGQNIYKQKITSINTNISLSYLPKGVYYIKVKGVNKSLKIIKI